MKGVKTAIGSFCALSILAKSSFIQVLQTEDERNAVAAVVGGYSGSWMFSHLLEKTPMENRDPIEKPWSLSGSSAVRIQRMVIVSDIAAFTGLLKEHNPYFEPIPTIDFKKMDVVACFGGMKPSGGYSMTLKSVEKKDNSTLITFELHAPPPGAIVTMAFTRPSLLIAIPKTTAPVEFRLIIPKP